MNPGEYLSNKREAELADRVWQIALKQPQRTYNDVIHKYFSSLPWVNQNMIKARDWITYYRELDGDGGIRSVNNQFVPVTDYTAIEIGNVEHFYVAAFMYSLGGPTDPLWALVTVDA
jgi:hypothetical protein